MYSEDTVKAMMDLFADPLFKKNFFDFFGTMQKEGIDAAKKFWGMRADKAAGPFAPDFFEKLVDFYIVLGFVPSYKLDEVMKERDGLKREVEFLKNTLKELQQGVYAEGSKKAQEAWKSVVDKQFDMNKEIAKDFFELFRELK